MTPRRAFAVAAIALAALAGCGDGDGDSDVSAASSTTTTTASEAAAEPNTVVLKGVKFNPERLTVKVGDTVTWKWDDGKVPHDVNGGDAFKSEIQEAGTFEHTFTEAGEFEYKCTVHPTMMGTVEVTE